MEKTVTPTLDSVLQALYDSEINVTISWFWDGGMNLVLGDNSNGIRAATTVDTTEGAARWLIDAAKRHYPASAFAKAW